MTSTMAAIITKAHPCQQDMGDDDDHEDLDDEESSEYDWLVIDTALDVIIGVSKDTAAKHDKFKAKYNLAFPLLSDEEGKLCEAFGVWVEKSMYGRKYFGIERSTFLIDANGLVAKVWRKVKVTGHAKDVLAAVKAL